MKYMLSALIIVGMIQGCGTTGYAGSCNAKCVHIVRRLLEESAAGISTGYGEKQSYRLGDKIGAALPRIYKKKDMVKAKNVRIFLPVIQAAFLHPELISNQQDRMPTATLRLLRDLESKTNDPKIKSDISKMIDWLSEHEKSLAQPPKR